MPNLNFSDYGIVGIALAMIGFIALKVIDSRKEAGKTTQMDKEDEMKAILQNNTAAITELTQFLKTQAEVDKEKEKQSNKQLDTIENKIDDLLKLQAEHNIKCETKCQGGM